MILPGRAYLELLEACALAGSGVYDALIAATTRHVRATLLTRDPRARAIHDRLEVRNQFVR